jgi:membrane-associated phospholipid phosphatase
MQDPTGVSYLGCMDGRAKTLLWMVAGCAFLFALVVLGAYVWGPAETLDNEGLAGFVNANHGWVRPISWRLTDFGDPPTVAAITLALAALALVRGRPRVAMTVIGLVAATSISSQVLKALLAHPRFPPIFPYPFDPEALPSGHATAAMSLALAGVLAVPRRARPFAALLGSLLALAVGAAVVGVGWHFPSDVIAGYLLSTGWALCLWALLYEADRRFPARERWASNAIARASDKITTGGLAIAAAGATTLGVVATAGLLITDTSAAACFAREHTSFVVVAGGIASAALVLPLTMASVARRD